MGSSEIDHSFVVFFRVRTQQTSILQGFFMKRKLLKACPVVRSEQPQALAFLGTVAIPATSKKIIAAERFRLSNNSDTRIGYISDSVLLFFGHIINDIVVKKSDELHYYELLEAAFGDQVVVEFGCKRKIGTTFSAAYALLKKQGCGQAGELLINGLPNVFFVKDVSGILRVVNFDYHDLIGWRIYAHRIDIPQRHLVGSRFFFRNLIV